MCVLNRSNAIVVVVVGALRMAFGECMHVGEKWDGMNGRADGQGHMQQNAVFRWAAAHGKFFDASLQGTIIMASKVKVNCVYVCVLGLPTTLKANYERSSIVIFHIRHIVCKICQVIAHARQIDVLLCQQPTNASNTAPVPAPAPKQCRAVSRASNEQNSIMFF